MANAPLSLIDAPEDHAGPARILPSSPIELHLHLEDERPPRQWAAILGASFLLHVLFFFIAIQLPSFVPLNIPDRKVIVRRIPLYLPPDVLTQKAPNRRKISKSIDLEDLLSQSAEQPHESRPRPSVKRFEIPKQAMTQKTQSKSPQILPEAPKIALNQAQGPPPVGAVNGLPTAAPPPQTSSSGPFQNIGSETPPNPHPTLAPPRTDLQTPINGSEQGANSNRMIISDDNASTPSAGTPGTPGQLGSPHSAVELQSDPQGANFKPYLTRILAIVRANWRRVMPESARMGLLHGRTVLEFIIDRNGGIPKLVLADSSGSDPLDRAAIAGLSMSNPLPPLPADFKGFQVRLAFTFSYNVPTK